MQSRYYNPYWNKLINTATPAFAMAGGTILEGSSVAAGASAIAEVAIATTAISGIAAKVTSVVGNSHEYFSSRDNSIYVLKGGNDVKYVGITNNPRRRQ